MDFGEYKISCPKCQFEGRFLHTYAPIVYLPEEGCHKSAIERGWCNSCETITRQHSGQAGSYSLSDYGVRNEYEHHGPPEVRRGLFGGKALPWAGVQWQLKELKTELKELISENAQNTGVIQRLLHGRKLKENAQRIQACNAEIEKCERLTKLYKDTHERAMRDTQAANEFFGFGRKPRCLECSSHDVRSEGAEGLPHGCGEPLHWEQLTRERGTFVGAELRYYDNDGLIVRKETKF